MATLDQMRARYTQHQIAEIFQYEGYPITQPRISEAISPRKDRSAEAARKRYKELDRIARTIDLRKYPKGVPEAVNVVNSRKAVPPIYQSYRVRNRWYHAGSTQLRRVTKVSTGNAPDKDYADMVSWSRPRVVVPRWSVEKLVAAAVERFGAGRAKVTVLMYGTFAANFGRYIDSQRFSGFKEDYYAVTVPMSEVFKAVRAETSDTIHRLSGIKSTKVRSLIEDGDPEDPEDYPGFAARWANRFHPVKWIEVNYIDILKPGPKKG